MFTIGSDRRVVGLQLPVQARSTYFVAEWERTAGPTEMAAVAKAADDSGFGYVGVCDHVALPEAVADSMGYHWVDPIATLGWLAAQTTNVRLLTHVYVLPYRHPRLAAKQFATLDDLSGGRVICGVGAGHVEAEFDLLGVEFAGRGADMDAGVTELAELLANEVVDGFGALPRPVQTPRPPIWLAGSSAPAIRRAARLGDGWLPQGPATIEALALLTAERERLGRDGEPFAVGTITPFLYVGDASWDLPADTVHGSAQQVAEQLAALVPAAVNQIQVRFRARDVNEMCDQVTAFGEGVLEALTTM